MKQILVIFSLLVCYSLIGMELPVKEVSFSHLERHVRRLSPTDDIRLAYAQNKLKIDPTCSHALGIVESYAQLGLGDTYAFLADFYKKRGDEKKEYEALLSGALLGHPLCQRDMVIALHTNTYAKNGYSDKQRNNQALVFLQQAAAGSCVNTFDSNGAIRLLARDPLAVRYLEKVLPQRLHDKQRKAGRELLERASSCFDIQEHAFLISAFAYGTSGVAKSVEHALDWFEHAVTCDDFEKQNGSAFFKQEGIYEYVNQVAQRRIESDESQVARARFLLGFKEVQIAKNNISDEMQEYLQDGACYDPTAYVFLADYQTDSEKKIEYYKNALQAFEHSSDIRATSVQSYICQQVQRAALAGDVHQMRYALGLSKSDEYEKYLDRKSLICKSCNLLSDDECMSYLAGLDPEQLVTYLAQADKNDMHIFMHNLVKSIVKKTDSVHSKKVDEKMFNHLRLLMRHCQVQSLLDTHDKNMMGIITEFLTHPRFFKMTKQHELARLKNLLKHIVQTEQADAALSSLQQVAQQGDGHAAALLVELCMQDIKPCLALEKKDIERYCLTAMKQDVYYYQSPKKDKCARYEDVLEHAHQIVTEPRHAQLLYAVALQQMEQMAFKERSIDALNVIIKRAIPNQKLFAGTSESVCHVLDFVVKQTDSKWLSSWVSCPGFQRIQAYVDGCGDHKISLKYAECMRKHEREFMASGQLASFETYVQHACESPSSEGRQRAIEFCFDSEKTVHFGISALESLMKEFPDDEHAKIFFEKMISRVEVIAHSDHPAHLAAKKCLYSLLYRPYLSDLPQNAFEKMHYYVMKLADKGEVSVLRDLLEHPYFVSNIPKQDRMYMSYKLYECTKNMASCSEVAQCAFDLLKQEVKAHIEHNTFNDIEFLYKVFLVSLDKDEIFARDVIEKIELHIHKSKIDCTAFAAIHEEAYKKIETLSHSKGWAAYAMALKYVLQATSRGNSDSKTDAFFASQNFQRILYYLRKAKELKYEHIDGDIETISLRTLAEAYQVLEQMPLACRFYKEAAERGDFESSIKYAQLAWNGHSELKGQDALDDACVHLLVAVGRGSVDARTELKMVLEKGQCIYKCGGVLTAELSKLIREKLDIKDSVDSSATRHDQKPSIELGDAWYAQGEYAKAAEIFKQLSQDAHAKLKLGMLYLHNQVPCQPGELYLDKAVDIFTEILNQSKSDATPINQNGLFTSAWNGLGTALSKGCARAGYARVIHMLQNRRAIPAQGYAKSLIEELTLAERVACLPEYQDVDALFTSGICEKIRTLITAEKNDAILFGLVHCYLDRILTNMLPVNDAYRAQLSSFVIDFDCTIQAYIQDILPPVLMKQAGYEKMKYLAEKFQRVAEISKSPYLRLCQARIYVAMAKFSHTLNKECDKILLQEAKKILESIKDEDPDAKFFLAQMYTLGIEMHPLLSNEYSKGIALYEQLAELEDINAWRQKHSALIALAIEYSDGKKLRKRNIEKAESLFYKALDLENTVRATTHMRHELKDVDVTAPYHLATLYLKNPRLVHHDFRKIYDLFEQVASLETYAGFARLHQLNMVLEPKCNLSSELTACLQHTIDTMLTSMTSDLQAHDIIALYDRLQLKKMLDQYCESIKSDKSKAYNCSQVCVVAGLWYVLQAHLLKQNKDQEVVYKSNIMKSGLSFITARHSYPNYMASCLLAVIQSGPNKINEAHKYILNSIKEAAAVGLPALNNWFLRQVIVEHKANLAKNGLGQQAATLDAILQRYKELKEAEIAARPT